MREPRRGIAPSRNKSFLAVKPSSFAVVGGWDRTVAPDLLAPCVHVVSETSHAFEASGVTRHGSRLSTLKNKPTLIYRMMAAISSALTASITGVSARCKTASDQIQFALVRTG